VSAGLLEVAYSDRFDHKLILLHDSLFVLCSIRNDHDPRRYRAKVDAERKAKNDRFRAERAAEDSARRDEQIQRMREEAKEPAFGREIEDCGVLIGWFERQYGSGESQQQQQQGGVLGAIKGAIDGVSRRCF
jgi:hypothetical protein